MPEKDWRVEAAADLCAWCGRRLPLTRRHTHAGRWCSQEHADAWSALHKTERVILAPAEPPPPEPVRPPLAGTACKEGFIAVSCASKTRWDTEKAARRAVAKIAQQRFGRLYTYACEFCGGWHLTKKRQRM